MKQQGLEARRKRKFVHTTDSRHELPVADNILDRRFNPDAADQAWVADIAYIRTERGRLYLAAVLDLYSRKVVGWAMAPHMPAELVCTARQMAIALRRPNPGLIVHTDRGSQYTSQAHCDRAQTGRQHEPKRQLLGPFRHGVVLPEPENGTGLAALLRQSQRCHCRHTHYMVGFYNTHRLRSILGYRSPADY